jgi:hypothetical protein
VLRVTWMEKKYREEGIFGSLYKQLDVYQAAEHEHQVALFKSVGDYRCKTYYSKKKLKVVPADIARFLDQEAEEEDEDGDAESSDRSEDVGKEFSSKDDQ